MRRSYIVIAVLSTLLSATALAEKVQVAGTIVDARGKAMKDVTVGVRWAGTEKKLEAGHSVASGKDGSFEIELDLVDGKPIVLVAMDKARRNMGYAEIAADEKSQTVKIALDKTLTVNGTFDVSTLSSKPDTVEMIVKTSREYEIVRIELAAKKRFAVKLPPGEFLIALECEGGNREARAVALPEKKTTHDLGKLALRREADKAASPTNENTGEAPPAGRKPPKLTVTDSVGVAKSVKLEDYKGKWVFLEVWGFW